MTLANSHWQIDIDIDEVQLQPVALRGAAPEPIGLKPLEWPGSAPEPTGLEPLEWPGAAPEPPRVLPYWAQPRNLVDSSPWSYQGQHLDLGPMGLEPPQVEHLNLLGTSP